jgi:hypothetical protein
MDDTRNWSDPEFYRVLITYTRESDARDPIAVELEGNVCIIKLVLPDGRHFLDRIVAQCLDAIPPQARIVERRAEDESLF